MTRARLSLLLPLLASVAPVIAACKTERKPLTGFATPPPGIVLDWNGGDTGLAVWPIFDLPEQPFQTFRTRLNGQDVIMITSEEGFYDYYSWDLAGWTGGFDGWIRGFPAGTYAVEIVDNAGQSWGQSAPLSVPAGTGIQNPPVQLPTVLLAHFDGQARSWTIDPTTKDADPATDEITITNLIGEDVLVERCLITAAGRTACTPVGTVAPGGDLFTVETVGPWTGDHPALFIHLATDASQSYQRDLQGTAGSAGTCQIERILVHGSRTTFRIPAGGSAFALSSCYGYESGAPAPAP